MTEVLDFLKQPIHVGHKIVYATAQGSSNAQLTLATVVELREMPPTTYGPKVKVVCRRVRTATTTFKPGREYDSSTRDIFLTDGDRIVVVGPDAE